MTERKNEKQKYVIMLQIFAGPNPSKATPPPEVSARPLAAAGDRTSRRLRVVKKGIISDEGLTSIALTHPPTCCPGGAGRCSRPSEAATPAPRSPPSPSAQRSTGAGRGRQPLHPQRPSLCRPLQNPRTHQQSLGRVQPPTETAGLTCQ